VDKVIYFNDLFAIYKKLLTDKEQEIFSLYYEENLSLGEIGEFKGISRAAIGKTIKVVKNKLEDLEANLKIDEKNKKIKEISNKIKEKEIREELLSIINK